MCRCDMDLTGSGHRSGVSFCDDNDRHWCSLTVDTEPPASYLGGSRFGSETSYSQVFVVFLSFYK
jgi:hypothetical protein